MSAAADTHGHDDHQGAYGGIMRRITTTNHKDIGTLHLVFSLTMLFVGFADIACEFLFSQPGSSLWS